ncbi:MAG: helix-turn-helix transcriptional regulator [Dehalococcoidales bacterium]|nr:helix-turn-helix transcriptional regulator [Dehalococcoidales bacterium]
MVKEKSLRQLAKDLEISPSYLSMVLSGQRNPNIDIRNKLCSLGMFTSEAMFVSHNPKVVGSNPTPATNS